MRTFCCLNDTSTSQVHKQLTLKTRSAAVQTDETNQDTVLQHTTVSCLVCGTITYRVHSILPSGSEAKEGPVLPTDEWVESDVLLSKTGWIGVHIGQQGCIVSGALFSQISEPPLYPYLCRVDSAVMIPPIKIHVDYAPGIAHFWDFAFMGCDKLLLQRLL